MRWTLVALGVVAVLVGGVATWAYMQFQGINRADVDLAETVKSEPMNFLVVGSDTRDLPDGKTIDGGNTQDEPGGQRADTILIARADPNVGTVEMLAIPRDLWVSDGKGGNRRINSAYADGPQGLIDAINESLGIPVHHYLEVNFASFEGLVNALGGVPMYFDRPVYDKNTDLNIKQKGCYVLDGHQALAFSRSRHLVYSNGVKWIEDGTGDLGRITRQQVFLRRALSQVTDLGLNNVGTLTVLTTLAKDYLTIDDELGIKDMMDLMGQFAEFNPSGMAVHRIATTSRKTSGGAWVEELNEKKSAPVIDIFTGASPMQTPEQLAAAAIKPESVDLDVLNGTQTAGLARSGADALGELKFSIVNVGDGTPVDATTIRYAEGFEKEALLVASKISPTPTLEIDPKLANGKIVLILAEKLVVPGVNAPATTIADGPMGGAATTTVPASGESEGGSSSGGSTGGTATQVSTPAAPLEADAPIGLLIGDPPPGVTCEG